MFKRCKTYIANKSHMFACDVVQADRHLSHLPVLLISYEYQLVVN